MSSPTASNSAPRTMQQHPYAARPLTATPAMPTYRAPMNKTSSATRFFRGMLTLALTLGLVGVASAQERSISTQPQAPIADQPFNLILTTDACDIAVPQYDPLNRAVDVANGVVTVTIEYIDNIWGTPPGNCVDDDVYSWAMPPLPAGSYTLLLRGTNEDGEFPEDIAEAPLTIGTFAPSMPSVGPSTSTWALAALGIGLALLGWLRRR